MIGTPNVLSGGQHIPIIKSGMTKRSKPRFRMLQGRLAAPNASGTRNLRRPGRIVRRHGYRIITLLRHIGCHPAGAGMGADMATLIASQLFAFIIGGSLFLLRYDRSGSAA